MDNGKHFSPSNGQQPMAPKPVVPTSRRSASRGAHTKASGFASYTAPATGTSGASGGPRLPRWFKSRRNAVVAALSAALVVAGIGGVIAWTTAQDALTNMFEIGTVDPVIAEDFNPRPDSSTGSIVKKDVKATNKGKSDMYVRASVNIYWIDSAGNQLWEEPLEGTDYARTYPPSDSNWILGDDGYYYWKSKVSADGSTENLIDSIAQNSSQVQADEEAGRKLVVDIDIQGIQADPASAVQEAWSVTVGSDGTLIVGQGA